MLTPVRTRTRLVVAVLCALPVLAGCADADRPTPRPVAEAGPLQAAPHGDGDSWKDTAGREYRMGLVNTPELGDCYGDVASRTRKELVADGFRAQVYETDRYGRSVSVITLADGRNLNVWMARHGYADDRYLAQYRGENPALAAQLDAAFAAAKRERAGLWGTCPPP